MRVDRDCLLTHPLFGSLIDRIVGATGLAYYRHRGEAFAQHVAEDMDDVAIRDLGQYLLSLDAAAIRRLAARLTIGETYFFRHREVFDGLHATLLPDLIADRQHSKVLRAWSAGCSNGSEVYSLAILLHRAFGYQLADWHLDLLGTDLNPEAIEAARQARYSQWHIRGLDPAMRKACFELQDNEFTLRSEFRTQTRFQVHNLISEPAPGLFDLILCRNVLIYFDAPSVDAVIDKLFRALRPGGYLIVGHAEPDSDRFQTLETVVLPGAVLYRRPPRAPQQPNPLETRRARLRQTADGTSPRAYLEVDTWDQLQQAAAAEQQQDFNDPIGHLHMAAALRGLGNPQMALNNARRALLCDQDLPLAHIVAGLCQVDLGAPLDARRSFDIARKQLRSMPLSRQVTGARQLTVRDLDVLAHDHLSRLQSAEGLRR